MTRGASFAAIVATYVVATAAAIIVVTAIDWHPIALIATSYAVATAVTYVVIQLTGNGSVFDAYWSVIPPAVAITLAVVADGAVASRQVALCVVFVAWGIRLTFNWARGWPGMHHEDWRYVKYKADWPLPAWAVDAIVVTIVPTLVLIAASLPLVPALVRGTNSFGILDVVGLIIMAVALGIETLADEQLRRFVTSKQPAGRILDTGLWSRIRHPNYLGEMGVWWGIWVISLAADPGWWWTVVGPVTLTALFVFASIPLLDERSLARRPGYDAHMARVPSLLPKPTRRGAAAAIQADGGR